MVLVDSCGRPLLNLRIAVTSQCNLRCQYCHGEGEDTSKHDESPEMTVSEIVRIVRIASSLGISRIKLTGGEPLFRKDILEIVEGIASVKGVTDLSMTTNGTLLAPLAKDLRRRGLGRVNISLPTLNEEIYSKLTGGRIDDALEGIKASVEAGFHPVKLNMIILKCATDCDFDGMLDFARRTGTILQLIELEPVNITNSYYVANHEDLDEYEDILRQKASSIETRRYMQNRHVYHLPSVDVEVVHPTENTEFCVHCTRVRVTSDGKLKPCLMRGDNLVDILTPMRHGASDTQLIDLFKLANQKRQPYNKN
jgi:cyclic pyranopterin phosphate synthase